MKWNKYTLTTTTEAEDLISSMMMDAGIEGIEIEDKIPLSEKDKSQMFVDILPEEDIKACQRIADSRGVHLKVRPWEHSA